MSPDDIIVDVGNDNHAIYIPAKLLEVLPGNYYGRVLSGDQQVKMIEFACRPAQGPRGNQHIISTDGLRLLGVRASPLQSLPVREILMIT